ncbi:MAG: choice-of-anchor D domain-containing protein [Myxococcota bacterium]
MRITTSGLAALFLVSCSEYHLSKDPVDPELPADAPQPDIEVDTLQVDFGVVAPSCVTSRDVVVRNVGDADLVVSGVTVRTGADYAVWGGPMTLAPGQESVLTVEFAPGTVGVSTDSLDIASNDPDEALVQVGLGGEGDALAEIVEEYDQLGSPLPVDILFVVDNSTSMGDENLALRNNFNTFIQGFLTLGLDFQIGVVTTDMQTAGFQGQLQGPIISASTPNPVQQFNQNTDIPFTSVMEEQGLDAAIAALTPPLVNGANAGLVRPGSLLSVIVISDEDDQSLATTADAIALLDAYQGDPALTSLSIVGGPTGGIWPCGGFLFGAAPVPRYWAVAQATGGIHLNLCQLDMGTIVQQLAVVAAGLDTVFPLSEVPADPGAIEVWVDGTPVPQDPANGWIYDGASNSVVFAGLGIPGAGARIRIVLGTGSGCMQ